jgi:hypothetical protein
MHACWNWRVKPDIGPMNLHLRDFLSGLEARYPDDTSVMPMSTYLERNTRLKKEPFSFRGYEFQRRIADDMHPQMSVVKPSQVGLSELQLRKFLAMLKRTTALTGIYTLPTDKMRDRLSQTRIKPLVDSEPIFNGPTPDKPVRHKGLYQIDDSFGYVTGSTEGDATSIPADFLMHDEIDLTDQRMIGLFQSRLQGSDYRITQRFSTPTYFGYGIEATYSASDQHEYMHKCSHCNHHQIPIFHPRFLHLPGIATSQITEDLTALTDDDVAQIEMADAYVRCERCSRPLELLDPERWQWVATYPTRRTRGYRIRSFNAARHITIPYIFDQLVIRRQASDLKGFHNTVLGDAFNDANARLSEEAIRACLGTPQEPPPNPGEPLAIGVDMGLICHVVLGGPSRTIGMWQVPQSEIVDFIHALLRRYAPVLVAGCIDRFPYTPTAEEIRDLPGHECKVMPVAYTRPDSAPLTLVKDDFERPSHYSANRTRALDQVAKAVRQNKITFSGFGAHQPLVIGHLRGMIRIEKPDTAPIWNKVTEQDHFFHAISYMLLGFRMHDVVNFNSTQETRSSFFLFGSNVNNGSEVSLHQRGRPAR